jgi:hypothetical protein
MNRERHRLPMVVTLCLTLAGCGTRDVPQQAATGLSSKIGYVCTVQFRRDALGAASSYAIPPTTNSMNGSEVSFAGVLKDVKGDWLVIERQDGAQTVETWVPIHSVLLLEWSQERRK